MGSEEETVKEQEAANEEETEKPFPMFEHVAPAKNEAVALCFESYCLALAETEEREWSRVKSLRLAANVYRRALPPLAGREDIRDFIACVTHAMLMKIFEPEEVSRLLYAAQVAQSCAGREQAKAR